MMYLWWISIPTLIYISITNGKRRGTLLKNDVLDIVLSFSDSQNLVIALITLYAEELYEEFNPKRLLDDVEKKSSEEITLPEDEITNYI